MRKTTAALAGGLVAALAAATGWYLPQYIAERRADPAPPQVTAQAPATPPAAAAPAPEVVEQSPSAERATGQPVEEVETTEGEQGLGRIIPKQSIGHAAGLHKVEDPLRLHSSSAIVLDTGSNEVLYSKNDRAVLPIASLTKVMTALVVLDARQPMDDVLTITEDDIDKVRSSRSRVRVGTTMTRGEALHLALMSSENRAAHALGRHYPGGMEAFVRAMNAKAKQLGMAQTHYVDPTGLSTDNQSTARDLAILTKAAWGYQVVRDFSTTPAYRTVVGERTLQFRNSNRLVRSEAWDIELQKTGYIVEAGYCVLMHADVAGKDVVMVLLDADGNSRRFADAEKLRRWLGGAPPAPTVAKKAAKPDRKVAAAKKGGKKGDATATAKGKKGEATATAKGKKATATATAKKKPAARDTRTASRDKQRVRKQYAAGGEDKKS